MAASQNRSEFVDFGSGILELDWVSNGYLELENSRFLLGRFLDIRCG